MAKIGLLITARLKSSRLPLKVLNELGGGEIVAQVIRRAKQVHGISEVILCTSGDPQDAPLARIALREGVQTYNGHPDDVLLRLRDAAKFFGLDACVSITADNPFFCVHHANRVVDLLSRKPNTDYVYIDGLPIGTAVYGISTAAMTVVSAVKSHSDTEIWGPFVNRPDIFNVEIIKATCGYNISARLTIDEPADYLFAVQLVSRSSASVSRITLPEIDSLLEAFPNLRSINEGVKQMSSDPAIVEYLDRLFLEKADLVRNLLLNARGAKS